MFRNIYFVVYLQRLLLPLATSAVDNVLTFDIKASWINDKLLLHFLNKVTQLDVVNLTYVFITLCVYSALLAPPVFFSSLIWNISYLKHSSKGISWFFSIYAYILLNISYLHCLDLILCLYLWARTCGSIICIAIRSFRSLWCDCIFFMYSK